MKFGRRWAILALVAMLITLSSHPVLAQGDDPTQSSSVRFADVYLLLDGESVSGDLMVVGQSITLNEGSLVTGDVALIGEEIAVAGEIRGELTILGDHILLMPSAHVYGDVHLCGKDNPVTADVRIDGLLTSNCDQLGDLLGRVVPLAFDPSRWEWNSDDVNLNPADWRWNELSQIDTPVKGMPLTTRIAINLVMALVFGGLAGVITLICPLRLRRVSDALLESPGATTGIGLLSLLIAAAATGLVILSFIVLVGFCLAPFLGLSWIVLALMIVMGWTGLSLPVGAWLLSRLEVRRVSPFAAASVGAILLSFLAGLLTFNTWTTILYFFLMIGLTGWGLGAVVLTRFGGQAYPNPVRKWTGPKPKHEDYAVEL